MHFVYMRRCHTKNCWLSAGGIRISQVTLRFGSIKKISVRIVVVCSSQQWEKLMYSFLSLTLLTKTFLLLFPHHSNNKLCTCRVNVVWEVMLLAPSCCVMKIRYYRSTKRISNHYFFQYHNLHFFYQQTLFQFSSKRSIYNDNNVYERFYVIVHWQANK